MDVFRRVFSCLGFKPYVREVRVGDVCFRFLIADRTGLAWYSGEEQEPSPEYRFTKGMLKPGDRVLEVGAHHGFFTLLLSRWVGKDGKIMAVEALPANCDILRENIRINSVSNVCVENKAVSDRNGPVMIRGGSNSSVVSRGWDAAFKVEGVRLDDYAEFKPDMIKIDVEGFEVNVLQGGAEILKFLPSLAIEVHIEELKQYGHSAQEIVDILKPLGYALWLQSDGLSEPAPYDGSPITKGRQIHLYAMKPGQ